MKTARAALWLRNPWVLMSLMLIGLAILATEILSIGQMLLPWGSEAILAKLVMYGSQGLICLCVPTILFLTGSVGFQQITKTSTRTAPQISTQRTVSPPLPNSTSIASRNNAFTIIIFPGLGIVIGLIVNTIANMLILPHSPYLPLDPDMRSFWFVYNILCCSPVNAFLGSGMGVMGGFLGRRSSAEWGIIGALVGGTMAGALTWVIQWSIWFLSIPM